MVWQSTRQGGHGALYALGWRWCVVLFVFARVDMVRCFFVLLKKKKIATHHVHPGAYFAKPLKKIATRTMSTLVHSLPNHSKKQQRTLSTPAHTLPNRCYPWQSMRQGGHGASKKQQRTMSTLPSACFCQTVATPRPSTYDTNLYLPVQLFLLVLQRDRARSVFRIKQGQRTLGGGISTTTTAVVYCSFVYAADSA